MAKRCPWKGALKNIGKLLGAAVKANSVSLSAADKSQLLRGLQDFVAKLQKK